MLSKQEPLQKLQNEGYFAVSRALAAAVMTWDKESLLAKLRKELNISDAMHKEVLDKVDNDEEVTAIKRGQQLPSAMQDASAGIRRATLAVSAPRRAAGVAQAGTAPRSATRPLSPAHATSSVSLSHIDLIQDSGDSGSSNPTRRGGDGQRSKYAGRQRDSSGGPRVSQQQQQQQQPQAQDQYNSSGGRSRSMLPNSATAAAPLSTARRRASKARAEHSSDGDDGGYVGQAVWRHWPNEPNGWVKGVISAFNYDTNEHTITYGMHTPGQQTWEEFDFTAAVQGEDFVLAGQAEQIVFESAARDLKRKDRIQEQLPYESSTLRQRLTGNNPAELQDMQEALAQRARELTAEIIALAAPESAYPDPVQRVEQQIQAASLRGNMLRAKLQGLAAA